MWDTKDGEFHRHKALAVWLRLPAAFGGAVGLGKRIALAGDGALYSTSGSPRSPARYPCYLISSDDGGYGILREYMTEARPGHRH